MIVVFRFHPKTGYRSTIALTNGVLPAGYPIRATPSPACGRKAGTTAPHMVVSAVCCSISARWVLAE
jgi:hypothetical protein